MSILEPLEITATHVVVKVPHLSGWGVIWDDFKRLLNITVNGQVLLFFRPSETEPAQINVFLLQENIPLSEVNSFIIFTLWSSQNPNDSQQLSDNKLKLCTGLLVTPLWLPETKSQAPFNFSYPHCWPITALLYSLPVMTLSCEHLMFVTHNVRSDTSLIKIKSWSFFFSAKLFYLKNDCFWFILTHDILHLICLNDLYRWIDLLTLPA